ncbi:MAG: type II secretion system protein GspG [Planctomycetaceae bacterium]|nr:type II secretion system protein GspG [Planctomycetaceae bacterium]
MRTLHRSFHPPAGRQRRAFTLLELMIVLAIIVVIAAMVVPNLVGSLQEGNRQATYATIKSVEKSLGLYAAAHNGTYPDSSQGWQEMIQPQDYKGKKFTQPFLEEIPTDAWKNQLQYEWDSKNATHSKKQGAIKPAIWSIGQNEQDEQGAGDDINNWTPQLPTN